MSRNGLVPAFRDGAEFGSRLMSGPARRPKAKKRSTSRLWRSACQTRSGSAKPLITWLPLKLNTWERRARRRVIGDEDAVWPRDGLQPNRHGEGRASLRFASGTASLFSISAIDVATPTLTCRSVRPFSAPTRRQASMISSPERMASDAASLSPISSGNTAMPPSPASTLTVPERD